jgi:hypothetical protein
MRLVTAGVASIVGIPLLPVMLLAQSPQPPQTAPSMTVPRVINIGGVFRPGDGGQPARVETVTLAIYSDENDGVPLWQETQTITVDASGRYSVLLGATEAEGIPLDVFMSGEARWLGITWLRAGEVEGQRRRLTSVPYALRAADADTLGGRPASAYQIAPPQGQEGRPSAPGVSVPLAVLPGTPNFLAKYLNTSDVGDSALFESGGFLGINTTTPLDVIHSRFSNSNGALTGFVVQNMANAAASYSGMLFRDHLGSVGMFQGFNNSTHEYRINNVASGGNINFMISGTSRFKVENSGRVLIHTTTPETASFLASGVQIRQEGNEHGLVVRKSTSDSLRAAVHARSAPGITGPVIKAIAGVADNVDYFWEAALIAVNQNTNGVGVRGIGALYAGQFAGDVQVTGTLSKGGGAFQIDHPLDPANKYLLHSFVESPDMMNIYNGNVTLDASGEASVTMPDWFESLNRDFRYQLTAIGAPGPNLYVAQEIVGNRFTIAGGTPNGKVSWQVTGIRQDPWANANRIPVEKDKAPHEIGRYLHPAARGLSSEMGVDGGGAQGVTTGTRKEQKQ